MSLTPTAMPARRPGRPRASRARAAARAASASRCAKARISASRSEMRPRQASSASSAVACRGWSCMGASFRVRTASAKAGELTSPCELSHEFPKAWALDKGRHGRSGTVTGTAHAASPPFPTSPTEHESSMGPLSGLKVIDLTHVMAGPTCTLMLADMGADVIKIEKWPNGDDTRHSVPPKIGDEAASFLMMNRNKRGIVLDLKTEGGKEVLRRLIATADVLVENFAPGAMERLGFGDDDLDPEFPALV